jgi:zinc protease
MMTPSYRYTPARLHALLFLCTLAGAALNGRAADDALHLPPFKKVKLDNGITLLLMERREIPIVSFHFIVKGGSVADPAGHEGLASITAALLSKGSKNRTADQFSADLDFIGGSLNATAGYDYSSGSAEFMKKDLTTGLDLLTDVLLSPTFPQDEFAKLAKQRLDGLKAAKDRAQGVINTYFEAFFYGQHPYGRPVGGDEKSLAALSRDDAARFYESWYTPGNTILAVAGDFDTAEMTRILRERFGAWAARNSPVVTVPTPTPSTGRHLLLVDKPDSTQTYFEIGNLGITRTNPDRVLIEVVNTLFGGRFTSMLNTDLRIKSGLTYGARSSFPQRKVAGPFVISSFTANPTTEKALDMALEVLRRLHEKGVTEADLKSAKTYIKGQFPPRIETTDRLAALLADLEFYGLDESDINTFYAKIDAMTVADARRIIQQYYPLDSLVFVLIGKADEIRGGVTKYAPTLETRRIDQPGF